MSIFKITGVVTFVSPIETFGEGKQSKRIIVQTQDAYPNHFPISWYGAKIDAVNNINVGDFVEVETYPGGRLKKGDNTVAFTYLNGAAIMKVTTGMNPPTNKSEQAPEMRRTTATPAAAAAMFDDVPF